MNLSKLLSTLCLILFTTSCKEQLDLGVKETPRLTGLLKQIKVKSLEQTLTYTLDYDLEKKKRKAYTASYSAAKTSKAYVISQDTSGKILEMKNAAGTELVKYTYNIQGRLTEINSTFADKTSTKEKVSYENGRMDYYSKQLFQPDGSFTFPEARIYNIEGANLIGVVTSRLTKNDLSDKSRGSSLQVRDRVSPTEPHLPCCRNWTARSLFSSQKSARS
jgi:YD repeat-containing protein